MKIDDLSQKEIDEILEKCDIDYTPERMEDDMNKIEYKTELSLKDKRFRLPGGVLICVSVLLQIVNKLSGAKAGTAFHTQWFDLTFEALFLILGFVALFWPTIRDSYNSYKSGGTL